MKCWKCKEPASDTNVLVVVSNGKHQNAHLCIPCFMTVGVAEMQARKAAEFNCTIVGGPVWGDA